MTSQADWGQSLTDVPARGVTTLSVVILMSIVEVRRKLADIELIARSLPAVLDAHHDPGATSVVLRGDGEQRPAAVTVPCELRVTPAGINWAIGAPNGYRGRIDVFGDASVSQLRSTLAPPAPKVTACVLEHVRFLRRLADLIEGQESPWTGPASPNWETAPNPGSTAPPDRASTPAASPHLRWAEVDPN
jgi:hypothetical protein